MKRLSQQTLILILTGLMSLGTLWGQEPKIDIFTGYNNQENYIHSGFTNAALTIISTRLGYAWYQYMVGQRTKVLAEIGVLRSFKAAADKMSGNEKKKMMQTLAKRHLNTYLPLTREFWGQLYTQAILARYSTYKKEIDTDIDSAKTLDPIQGEKNLSVAEFIKMAQEKLTENTGNLAILESDINKLKENEAPSYLASALSSYFSGLRTNGEEVKRKFKELKPKLDTQATQAQADEAYFSVQKKFLESSLLPYALTGSDSPFENSNIPAGELKNTRDTLFNDFDNYKANNPNALKQSLTSFWEKYKTVTIPFIRQLKTTTQGSATNIDPQSKRGILLGELGKLEAFLNDLLPKLKQGTATDTDYQDFKALMTSVAQTAADYSKEYGRPAAINPNTPPANTPIVDNTAILDTLNAMELFLKHPNVINGISHYGKNQNLEQERIYLISFLESLRSSISRAQTYNPNDNEVIRFKNFAKTFWGKVDTYVTSLQIQEGSTSINGIRTYLSGIDPSHYPQSQQLITNQKNAAFQILNTLDIKYNNLKSYIAGVLIGLKDSIITMNDYNIFNEGSLQSEVNRLEQNLTQAIQNLQRLTTQQTGGTARPATPQTTTPLTTTPAIPNTTTRPTTTRTQGLNFRGTRGTQVRYQKYYRLPTWRWHTDSRGNYHFFVDGQEVDYETFLRAGGKIN